MADNNDAGVVIRPEDQPQAGAQFVQISSRHVEEYGIAPKIAPYA